MVQVTRQRQVDYNLSKLKKRPAMYVLGIQGLFIISSHLKYPFRPLLAEVPKSQASIRADIVLLFPYFAWKPHLSTKCYSSSVRSAPQDGHCLDSTGRQGLWLP